ncbi:MAG TPA: hypothetical protein VK436_15220 [Methanocella sp.]|nr:hypothetical protein [Methanocella sp.]
MVGAIKTLIDDIVEKRAKGNAAIASTMKTKLRLKGIDVDKYTAISDDDPVVLARLNDIYRDMSN